jgi:hypothetical protein
LRGAKLSAKAVAQALSRRAAPAMLPPRLSKDPAMTAFSDRIGAIVGRNAVGTPSFEAELVAERAAALGQAGRKVEEALARLNEDPDAEDRDARLKAAAKAVWSFFVQREACGFRDQKGVIAHYNIPRSVLVRLGAR